MLGLAPEEQNIVMGTKGELVFWAFHMKLASNMA